MEPSKRRNHSGSDFSGRWRFHIFPEANSASSTWFAPELSKSQARSAETLRPRHLVPSSARLWVSFGDRRSPAHGFASPIRGDADEHAIFQYVARQSFFREALTDLSRRGRKCSLERLQSEFTADSSRHGEWIIRRQRFCQQRSSDGRLDGAQGRGAQGGLDLVRRQGQHPLVRRQDQHPLVRRQDQHPLVRRQGQHPLVRRQGQHPEAMPILGLPVELAKSPSRLQLREQGGAFLGTQELGEDVPDLPPDVARSCRAISGKVNERRSSSRLIMGGWVGRAHQSPSRADRSTIQNGARCRVRTCDFLRVKQALYH